MACFGSNQIAYAHDNDHSYDVGVPRWSTNA